MNSLECESKTNPKDHPSAWAVLFKRFRTFKAARCERVTLKSVDWYLLPLIRDMEAQGVTLQEFADLHMEERLARRKQAGINNTPRPGPCGGG